MLRTLLLWIFAVSASINISAFRGPALDGVKDYEVVRPIRLHMLYKRETEALRPKVVRYAMTVDEKEIELQLEQNEELLTHDYSETYYTEDGTKVTSTPQHLDHCYYQGTIVNDSESMVSMSTCDGLRGYIKTASQKYLIEPLSGSEDGEHAVIKYEDQSSVPAVCGVTNTSWNPDYPTTSKVRSRILGSSILEQNKYIELYIVADNREYIKMKSNMPELRKKIFEIVNYVNLVYKPLNTFIALIGLEVWTDMDKISVTPPAGATLDAFNTWRNSQLTKPNDIAQLLTGIDFEGATVGLAYVGTLCSGFSAGVVQDYNDNTIAIGATMAHELGHSLGMNHDSSSCTCVAESCIMAAALSYNIPKNFSSCSIVSYDQFQTSRNPECILNKPDFSALISTPVCGNGFLELGEQCDCGTVQECTSKCCNASSCTFTKGSECAEGDCCENCKFLPTVRECRTQSGDCDLPEYCTGKAAVCPEDVFSVNGIPCNGEQGYCFNGQCPERSNQCVKMWGATAQVGSQYCYDQSTRGTYYAFCKRPSKDQYIACQKQDVLCGKLFCTAGSDNPSLGRLVMFGACKATFYDNYNNDLGQVDTGTKCGDGMVCSENECVDLQTAYKATNCSADCKGHAVCNHKKECQCEPGWLPPDCELQDKDIYHLPQETVIAVAVVLSLLILAILALAAFVYRRNRQRALPNSSSLPIQNKSTTTIPTTFSHVRTDNANQNHGTPRRPQVAPSAPPEVSIQSQLPTYIEARKALRPPPPRV